MPLKVLIEPTASTKARTFVLADEPDLIRLVKLMSEQNLLRDTHLPFDVAVAAGMPFSLGIETMTTDLTF